MFNFEWQSRYQFGTSAIRAPLVACRSQPLPNLGGNVAGTHAPLSNSASVGMRWPRHLSKRKA
jgi:hypothetical protein